MEGSFDFGELLWALGILAIPLILAIPARILYQTLILGMGPAEKSYRSTVQRILDAGMQVEQFREDLDDEARSLGIKMSRAKMNETDMLKPLTLTHFLLTPVALILPLMAILALPIIILGAPVLYGLEILLIRRKLLIWVVKSLETFFGKQIIHIPDPGYGHISDSGKMFDTSNIIIHFHHVPRVVFLGLFAWLIIHWTLRLDDVLIELLLSGVLYILLLGIVGIITTALESDLVLVDPARGRIMPISGWLESLLKPIIGVGLFFLLGRDLMFEARDGGNAVLFAATVVVVLYCATAVGMTFQWGYAWWHGNTVRKIFEEQAIDKLNPHSYDLTRNKGRIQLNVRCTMKERLDTNLAPLSTITFAQLDQMPSAHDGVIHRPENPLK
ncbi:MAG: hypothetical protein QGI21_03400 [Candidatus Poseidoniaceae archaeon]|jgi:hypothetical protein|nr:hypothetical protein [Candidatus Poseidoniaceae archaeon]